MSCSGAPLLMLGLTLLVLRHCIAFVHKPQCAYMIAVLSLKVYPLLYCDTGAVVYTKQFVKQPDHKAGTSSRCLFAPQ